MDDAKAAREQAIVDRFKGGDTVTDIAGDFEMTYQGVHRILKKHGLSRADGGKAKQMADRKAKETGTPSIQDRHGCTKEQWDELRAMDEDYKKTPLAAFNTFKNNFQNLNKETGIEFNITLWEWWELWKESGKWGFHMRNPAGMWVMAQKDRAQHLTKDNAQIIPFGELLKATRKTKAAKEVPEPQAVES